MELSIKLSDPLCMPTRANRTEAGLDLRSNHPSFFLLPHETKLIDTGLAVKIPEGFAGLVFARSGMGKFNVSPANCVGIIDSDYRGNIKINLHNYSLMSFEIPRYFRIGQLVITPILLPTLVESTESDADWLSTSRGAGGFGSTGNT